MVAPVVVGALGHSRPALNQGGVRWLAVLEIGAS